MASLPLPPTPPALLDPLPRILHTASLNLLAGASGIGKTALLSWLVKQFESGHPIFGHAVNPPPAVGYLMADRPWKGNRHWFDLSGVAKLRTYSLVDDASLKLPNQRMKHLRVEFFKTCVAKLQLPAGSLLFVDPIALFLGGNLLDYDTVGFACIEIQRWLQEAATQYCIVGICHSAKQKADKNDRYLRLQDRISGTMAQQGYTSTQMFLAGPDETGDKDGRHTFTWVSHSAPQETFQFPRGTNGLFLTDAAATLAAAPPPPLLPPFEKALYEQFPEDVPVATLQFIKLYADGGAAIRKRISRALRALESRGLIVQIRQGLWQKTPPK